MSTESLSGSGNTSTPHDPTSKREKTNEQDVDGQIALVEDHGSASSSVSLPNATPEQTVISFGSKDSDNPYQWSSKKKVWVVIVGIAMVMNSTIGSSIASGATDEISEYFHNDNEAQLVLPTSIYLVGYVLGPLVFAPLSESYGRKRVMIGTFVCHIDTYDGVPKFADR